MYINNIYIYIGIMKCFGYFSLFFSQDPHDELKHQNVLKVEGNVEQTSARFGLEAEVVNTALQKCRQILFDKRQERPRPHLDNKMVSAWNGMIFYVIEHAFKQTPSLRDTSMLLGC